MLELHGGPTVDTWINLYISLFNRLRTDLYICVSAAEGHPVERADNNKDTNSPPPVHLLACYKSLHYDTITCM